MPLRVLRNTHYNISPCILATDLQPIIICISQMARYLIASTHLLDELITSDHARLLCVNRQTFRRPQLAPHTEHNRPEFSYKYGEMSNLYRSSGKPPLF